MNGQMQAHCHIICVMASGYFRTDSFYYSKLLKKKLILANNYYRGDKRRKKKDVVNLFLNVTAVSIIASHSLAYHKQKEEE